MNSKKRVFVLIFLFFICISPWVRIGLRNKSSFDPRGIKKYQFINATRLYQINTFQGQTYKEGMGFFGRIIINKYTWIGKDILTRALESFDFNFLYFKGDLDIGKSTKNAGPILLTTFPLIFFGFLKLNKKRRITYISVIFLFSLFGAISEAHYDLITRIPFILLLTLLTAFGGLKLLSSSVKFSWKILYLILILFEFSRFLHDFIIHYPGRLMLGN